MPVFALFLGSIASALVTVFARFMTYKLALKLGAYVAWLGIYTVLLSSVYICINSLYQMVRGWGGGGGSDAWVQFFIMGVGMFVPANAGAVLSCVAGVWIATGIYKFQRDALLHFGA